MKNLFLTTMVAAILATAGLSATARAAEPPCEDMLAKLRATEQTAKLSEAAAKLVAELKAKGIERCNADDDKRADGFFAEAMKIMSN